jgi:hypothetical protein
MASQNLRCTADNWAKSASPDLADAGERVQQARVTSFEKVRDIGRQWTRSIARTR